MKKVVKNLANLKEVKKFAEKSTSEKIALVSKNLDYKGKYRRDLIATLVVIFQNLGGNYKSFDALLKEYKIVMNNDNPTRVGSNDKGRLRRNLTRNFEAPLTKLSEQSRLINLRRIISGIKIQSETEILYFENYDVRTETSDLNRYKFIINKNVVDRSEASIKRETEKAKERILKKAAKFKQAKEVSK